MAVKIRLKRMGKVRVPHYRVVVVDSRKRRDGRVIEEIGQYHPKEDPSVIELTSDRAQYWLGVGAQPTEAVQALLKITGDWQRFKSLPGGEGTLRVADPKRDKAEIFNEALKDSSRATQAEATTPRSGRSSARRSAQASAEGKPADTPGDETPEGAAATADVGEAQPAEADSVEQSPGDQPTGA